MIRRSWSQVKSELARIAGASGMVMSDSRVMSYANVAIEELMQEGDWPSIVDRYNFRVYGGTITLPQDYERILYMKLNGISQVMQSPWYEFIGYGPTFLNDQPVSPHDTNPLLGVMGVLDRDDVCTFLDIPPVSDGVQYTLRVASTVQESSGATVIIQGLDGNGDFIRSNFNGEWIEGVAFVLSGAFPQVATSGQVFSKITGVIKPATRQPVNCYYVPVGGGSQTQIAHWEANATNISYRRYRIPGLNDDTQYCIETRIRRRFAPITKDSDILLIGNLPALKNMVQAVYYAESNEKDAYATSKAIAIGILRKEATAYIGQQRQRPFIGFGGDGLAASGRGLYVQ